MTIITRSGDTVLSFSDVVTAVEYKRLFSFLFLILSFLFFDTRSNLAVWSQVLWNWGRLWPLWAFWLYQPTSCGPGSKQRRGLLSADQALHLSTVLALRMTLEQTNSVNRGKVYHWALPCPKVTVGALGYFWSPEYKGWRDLRREQFGSPCLW